MYIVEAQVGFHSDCELARSRIHEHTISLMFLGIILRVLRLAISVYNVYITNRSLTNFARGGGGVNLVVEVTE